MAPVGLQYAPRANNRKGLDIDSCRRRRRRRRRLRRRLLLSRRSLRPPVLKQRAKTDNSRYPVHFAKVAVLGWAGGDSRSVNNFSNAHDPPGPLVLSFRSARGPHGLKQDRYPH